MSTGVSVYFFGFRQGVSFGVWELRFRAKMTGRLRVRDLRLGAWGQGFEVWGLAYRV